MHPNISPRKVVTLEQFIIEREQQLPFATGEFSQIIRDLGLAAKMVNREVNKAGLVDILGFTGEENVQGEKVQKLDIFANLQFLQALRIGGQVCVIGSEENEEVIPVENSQNSEAKYVVLLDPLDGSSNIDVNVSIGTIFSIYRRITKGNGPGTEQDCLQKGTEQVCAGYFIYGSSTMLVYTTGNGVNGFTLDPSIGEFLLSHRDIKIPATCNIYSLNEGNYRKFYPGIKEYLRHIKGKYENSVRPYSTRYIGSLVADFHRNLLRGGVFIYPAFTDRPKGKLRLMYEANPMAFLTEQAGGMATNGEERIMDLQPTQLHQRTPLYLGNVSEVTLIHEYLRKYDLKKIN
ncbi:MAG: class 1 fructose-bisphosphatase [Bacteroidia bacterium]|nr:class 1 fructose-bisphosphatase [Bacteroidia bacterium]